MQTPLLLACIIVSAWAQGPYTGFIPIQQIKPSAATNSFFCVGSSNAQPYCGYGGCTSGCQDWHNVLDSSPTTAWNWVGCQGLVGGMSTCVFEVITVVPATLWQFSIQLSGYANRDPSGVTVAAKEFQGDAYPAAASSAPLVSTSALQTVTLSSLGTTAFASGRYFLFTFTTSSYQPYIFDFTISNSYYCYPETNGHRFMLIASPSSWACAPVPYTRALAPTAVTSSAGTFYCAASNSWVTTCTGCASGCSSPSKVGDGDSSSLWNPYILNSAVSLTFDYSGTAYSSMTTAGNTLRGVVFPHAFHVYFLGDGAHDRGTVTITGVPAYVGTLSSKWVTIGTFGLTKGDGGWQNFSIPLDATSRGFVYGGYTKLAMTFDSAEWQPLIAEAGFDRYVCPYSWVFDPIAKRCTTQCSAPFVKSSYTDSYCTAPIAVAQFEPCPDGMVSADHHPGNPPNSCETVQDSAYRVGGTTWPISWGYTANLNPTTLLPTGQLVCADTNLCAPHNFCANNVCG